MSDMVERVAKAIADDFEHPWDDDDPEVQNSFRSYARAAIAAMREPTEAMINAAECSWPPFLQAVPSDALIGVWKAMIDETLK